MGLMDIATAKIISGLITVMGKFESDSTTRDIGKIGIAYGKRFPALALHALNTLDKRGDEYATLRMGRLGRAIGAHNHAFGVQALERLDKRSGWVADNQIARFSYELKENAFAVAVLAHKKLAAREDVTHDFVRIGAELAKKKLEVGTFTFETLSARKGKAATYGLALLGTTRGPDNPDLAVSVFEMLAGQDGNEATAKIAELTLVMGAVRPDFYALGLDILGARAGDFATVTIAGIGLELAKKEPDGARHALEVLARRGGAQDAVCAGKLVIGMNPDSVDQMIGNIQELAPHFKNATTAQGFTATSIGTMLARENGLPLHILYGEFSTADLSAAHKRVAGIEGMGREAKQLGAYAGLLQSLTPEQSAGPVPAV